ncbi:MAG: hypothetical protein MUE68_02520 [Bacteroidetes bacterium]|jgi:hypothetical protein|nr:hypothetical protein [Bacteroidota bacterium]
MIDPEQFYAPSDAPSAESRRRMWTSVESRIRPQGRPWLVLERRSFALGMAASVLLLLAGFGTFSTVERMLDNSRPTALRVDQAYRSAIREFEILASEPPKAHTVSTQDAVVPRQEVFRSRQDELRSIDEGIASLRAEMTSGDISPVKRARLRDLYAKKLVVLQSMIEQGEITL